MEIKFWGKNTSEKEKKDWDKKITGLENTHKDDNFENETKIHDLIKKTFAISEEGPEVEKVITKKIEKTHETLCELEENLKKEEDCCGFLEKEINSLYKDFNEKEKIYKEKFLDVPLEYEIDSKKEEELLKSIKELEEKIITNEKIARSVLEKIEKMKEEIEKLEKRWENLHDLISDKNLQKKVQEN